jgi:hypothetical protein
LIDDVDLEAAPQFLGTVEEPAVYASSGQEHSIGRDIIPACRFHLAFLIWTVCWRPSPAMFTSLLGFGPPAKQIPESEAVGRVIQ